jgi:glycosyltransferase involved in cell wall biosynthesis
VNNTLQTGNTQKKIVFVVNVDWFFISHRLPLALEAKKKGYSVIIATTDTGRINELISLGFQTYDLKIDRSGTNPLKEISRIYKIFLILKKTKPAVVHNVTLKMAIYGSIASRFVKVPKVINAISGLGYNFTADRKTISKKIIYLLMNFAFKNHNNLFIFQNPDDLNLIKMLRVDIGNRYCIIKGVGVDLVKFSYSERERKVGIGFIQTARMLRDKGISEFIRASRIVQNKYPESRFLLVGDVDIENPASYTEKELRKELMDTTVIWLGYRSDIVELLQNSDIMVFPSYREGLPKSLIEAAAMGLPIITTDTAGCRECVDDGVNGFLVPVGDSTLLAEKMIQLIENPDLIMKMGKESRYKAEREFSIDSVLKKTLTLYEKDVFQ